MTPFSQLQKLIILLIVFCTSDIVHSQITIGSTEPPIEGALLDLKESTGQANSSKGLKLPKVKLTEIDKLYPMFTPNSDEYTGSEKDTQDKVHTGLVVYNTNKCYPFGSGFYVWDSKKWQGINNETLRNPWYSRQWKQSYSAPGNECSDNQLVTKSLYLNQTNYALKANNYFRNSIITYVQPIQLASMPIYANAAWIATLDDPENIFEPLNTEMIGSVNGTDNKDGTSYYYRRFVYKTRSGEKYKRAHVTFQDTAVIKRFEPITVSFVNCNQTDPDPTLNEWALRGGFGQAEIDQVLATGTDSRINPNNTIQLHRDQDGNLFFSARFGYDDAPTNTKENRWMINNLAAKQFALTGRTGDDVTVLKLLPPTPDAAHQDNYSTFNPTWGYPSRDYRPGTVQHDHTNPNTFNKNKRLGLFYDWIAAANSKGFKADGTFLNISDGEDRGALAQKEKIQGICPNGWHLPSDAEWTSLEMEFNEHTSLYSNLPDQNETIKIGRENTMTGTTIGLAMQDECEAVSAGYLSGAANPISADQNPGFLALNAGHGGVTGGRNINLEAYFFTSSAGGVRTTIVTGWIRVRRQYMLATPKVFGVSRERLSAANVFAAVRCKKD